jgi:hypothetical protein
MSLILPILSGGYILRLFQTLSGVSSITDWNTLSNSMYYRVFYSGDLHGTIMPRKSTWDNDVDPDATHGSGPLRIRGGGRQKRRARSKGYHLVTREKDSLKATEYKEIRHHYPTRSKFWSP